LSRSDSLTIPSWAAPDPLGKAGQSSPFFAIFSCIRKFLSKKFSLKRRFNL
jgi:hypothetical protein